MTENANRETAKIYQFPAGGRTGLAVRREGATTVHALKSAQAATAISTGSWYHDAAIEEAAEQARKR